MRTERHTDELYDRIVKAAAVAIRVVVEDAAEDARTSHPWKSRTGNLEGRIITKRAIAPRGSKTIRGAFGYAYARGRHGARDGFYGLFHEISTVHEHTAPTLRPAADRHFPRLAEEIREQLARSRRRR